MFDIRPMPSPVPAELLERARTAQPATIGHFRFRGFVDGAIRPLHFSERMVGTAVTLALPGMDSTLLHHAVGLLRTGDVLVIDRLGEHRHACLGGGVAVALYRAGVRAVIIDGPCTDPDELRDCGLAVWSRGVSPITTRVYGIGGAMNVPVSVGGAVACPGDLVIADEAGVVFLPLSEAAADVDNALHLQSLEPPFLAKIDQDNPIGKLSGATALVLSKLAPTGT
jgi:4-hydroxy-4-methyl-2-oxoglutarate aldolase